MYISNLCRFGMLLPNIGISACNCHIILEPNLGYFEIFGGLKSIMGGEKSKFPMG
jgi:hypothetical protein